MKKLTRHRQIIYDNLKSRKDHPTARMVFESVKDNFEKFSFATVYNSLEYLAENGYIKKLNIEPESIRFDATTEVHLHLLCKKCGNISDSPLHSEHFLENIENFFIPEDITITVRGLCLSCSSI